MGFAFPYDYKETDAKAFKDLAKIKWSEQSEFHLGIQTMEGNFVGVVGIQIDKNGKCTNFGYWLGEEFWGKGYATEAVNAALAFSFNKLKLYKVEAVAHSNNPASQKF
jgi:ribosomal-protein-alanine N-acetyltransferase